MNQIPAIEIPGLRWRRELGRGSSAHVWEAQDEQGRAVAVKVFTDSDSSQRAFDEAGVLAAVSHPNVINIHAVHRGSGGVAIVMDRCALTLQELITRCGPLRGAQVVGLVQQLSRGLSALHGAGLVHGDISPTNIGLTWDGVAQLLDFSGSRDVGTLGTPGFSLRGTHAALASHRKGGAAQSPVDVERRMHRLLSAARDREISLPGGIERARADVLAIARIGLYALCGPDVSPKAPAPTEERLAARGSVVAAVGEVLQQFVAAVETGTRQAQAKDLERVVGAVIPAAPIDMPPGVHAEQVSGAVVAQTRRADVDETVEPGDSVDALWADFAAPSSADEDSVENGRSAKGAGRPGRKKPRAGRRPALLGAAIVIGIAAIGGGIAIGSAENAISQEAGPGSAGEDPSLAQWQSLISGLGERRDLAIVLDDATLLEDVNAPDSPAQRADLQLFEFLAENSVAVTDFATQSTVREVLSADEGRTVLLVDTQIVLDERRIGSVGDKVDVSAARRTESGEMESIEMELVRVDHRWLISEIRKSRVVS